MKQINRPLGTWGIIRLSNICDIRVPDREEKRMDYKALKEIMIDNFPDLKEDINLQIKDIKRIQNRINQENPPQNI